MKKRGEKGADSKAATATDGAAPVPPASDSDAVAGTSSSGEGEMPALGKAAPEGDGPRFNTRSRTKGILTKENGEKKEKGGKKEEAGKKKVTEAPPKGAKSGRRAVKRKLKKGTTTPAKKSGAAKKRPDTPRPSPHRFAFRREMSGGGEPGGK